MLGTSVPSNSSALPMPVPKVSSSTTPVTPFAAPKRASAMPAASASLSTYTSVAEPVALVKHCVDVGTDPALVDVGRRPRDAVLDHRREGRADRTVPAGVGHQLGDDLGDGFRRGRARGQDAGALGHQLPGAGVDDRTLDARPADVDAERQVLVRGVVGSVCCVGGASHGDDHIAVWCDGGVGDTARDAAKLAGVAIRLATGAAELVREQTAGRSEIATKSTGTDLVTEVDRASERWLVEQIAAERPGDGVLGEEGGEREGRTGVRWVVDPIDGTVNFVLGIPAYAVSVAAEVDGEVVAGAVCNPVTGELFHARRGGGAFLGDARLAGPREVTLDRAVIGTGFGYDAAMRQRQGRVAAALLPRVGDVRRIGSAALDLCAVAAGRLDGYFEAGLNAWDRAAGGLVAEEAGCVVTGLRGAGPGSALVVAAGAGLAPALIGLLTELDADRVLG